MLRQPCARPLCLRRSLRRESTSSGRRLPPSSRTPRPLPEAPLQWRPPRLRPQWRRHLLRGASQCHRQGICRRASRCVSVESGLLAVGLRPIAALPAASQAALRTSESRSPAPPGGGSVGGIVAGPPPGLPAMVNPLAMAAGPLPGATVPFTAPPTSEPCGELPLAVHVFRIHFRADFAVDLASANPRPSGDASDEASAVTVSVSLASSTLRL